MQPVTSSPFSFVITQENAHLGGVYQDIWNTIFKNLDRSSWNSTLLISKSWNKQITHCLGPVIRLRDISNYCVKQIQGGFSYANYGQCLSVQKTSSGFLMNTCCSMIHLDHQGKMTYSGGENRFLSAGDKFLIYKNDTNVLLYSRETGELKYQFDTPSNGEECEKELNAAFYDENQLITINNWKILCWDVAGKSSKLLSEHRFTDDGHYTMQLINQLVVCTNYYDETNNPSPFFIFNPKTNESLRIEGSEVNHAIGECLSRHYFIRKFTFKTGELNVFGHSRTVEKIGVYSLIYLASRAFKIHFEWEIEDSQFYGWDKDESLVIIKLDNSLLVFDIQTGKKKVEFPSRGYRWYSPKLLYHPQYGHLAFVSGNGVEIHHINSGKTFKFAISTQLHAIEPRDAFLEKDILTVVWGDFQTTSFNLSLSFKDEKPFEIKGPISKLTQHEPIFPCRSAVRWGK